MEEGGANKSWRMGSVKDRNKPPMDRQTTLTSMDHYLPHHRPSFMGQLFRGGGQHHHHDSSHDSFNLLKRMPAGIFCLNFYLQDLKSCFMSKVSDSETALVLVGSVEFIQKPVSVFMRLTPPVQPDHAVQVIQDFMPIFLTGIVQVIFCEKFSANPEYLNF